MKRYISIIICFVFIQSAVFSQGQLRRQGNFTPSPIGTITGILIDSLTQKPIEYGNVVIFSKKDSSIVNGAVTDNSGGFTINNLMPGMYWASLTYIGYSRAIVDSILITPRSPEKNIGHIFIAPTSYQLSDVVVSSEKEVIINNLDKKVINVEKMITAAGGSALDIMQNIPSVSVNADGGISIRGNSNVTILVDGKPSALSGLSSDDVLTQIPASSIESIELVTNPSARYDPDGTAGIINIVLKKRTNLGINGMINLNAGTGDRYNSTLNLNYRSGDINFFANVDGRMNTFRRDFVTNRTNFLPSGTTYLYQLQNGKNQMISGNANIGADYLPDDFNTITLSVQFRRFGMNSESDFNNSLFNNSGNLFNYFTRASEGEREVNSMTYSLGYKRNFETKGHELTADVIYSRNRMNFDQSIIQQNFNTNFNPAGDPYLQNSEARNRHNMIIIQSNYVNPLSENVRIEGGWKSTIRDLSMRFNYFNYDYPSDLWIEDLNMRDYFNHKEQIHAAYAIYGGQVGSLRYQAGIRGEQLLADYEFSKGNNQLEKNYLSFYPSAFVVYNLSPGEEIRANYSRRVDRPHPRSLNPFVNYSDSLNISFGNPNLDPQYVNSFELGYSTFFGKTNVAPNLFLRHTTGLISSISALRDDGVTETTFRNVTDQFAYGIEITGATEILPWWRLNANYSFFQTEIKDADLFEGLTRKSDSWMFKVNSNITMWEGILFQVSGNYNSPIIDAQGKTKAMYTVDGALRKDFLNGDLTVTLRVSDIFNSRRFNSEMFGSRFVSYDERRFDSRNVFLGISYRFNNFRRSMDREREIRDDSEMDVF